MILPQHRSHLNKNSQIRRRSARSKQSSIRECAPPALYHGRRWGPWTLDVERLCLVYQGQPVDRGDGSGVTKGVPRYVAFIGSYEVDLERISDSASALDWIFQINGSIWGMSGSMQHLLNAIKDIFNPQSSLCSGACGSGRGGKVIENPGEFLRKRIATVGKQGAA